MTLDAGVWRVDGERCGGAEEAYLRFRALWDAAAGRAASRKMRGRPRCERIRDCGTPQDGTGGLDARYAGVGAVRCHVLGMIGSSYVRMFGGPAMPPEWREDWRGFLAWLMADSGRWRECGRRSGAGRTGRNYIRFRRNGRKRKGR